MESHWRIFTNAKKPETAERVLQKIQKKWDCEPRNIKIEPCHKGGHVISLELPHEFERWNDVVVDVITCMQVVGYGVSISSFIQEELDLVSVKSCVAGVDMITCHCSCTNRSDAYAKT